MGELKLSERISVGLAVNGEIVISRGTAAPPFPSPTTGDRP